MNNAAPTSEDRLDYDDDDELRSLFTCTLCEKMLAEPVRLKLCGHTFCRLCLVKHLRQTKSCAQCSRQLDDVSPCAYTTDLGLQELAYRCFPDATVNAMRRQFDSTHGKKSLNLQLCSVNLISLLQSHVGAEKVRVRIRMNRCAAPTTDSNSEMTLRCEPDVRVGSVKKVFARKFHIPLSNLRLFSADFMSLGDDVTISDVVLGSGDFDGAGSSLIQILADIHAEREAAEEEEEDSTQIDDEMPVLEAQFYESETTPLLEIPCETRTIDPIPTAPALQACTSEVKVELTPAKKQSNRTPQPTPLISTVQSTPLPTKKPVNKRRRTSENPRPAKIARTQIEPKASVPDNKTIHPAHSNLNALLGMMHTPASTSSSSSSCSFPTHQSIPTPTQTHMNRASKTSSIFAPTPPASSPLLNGNKPPSATPNMDLNNSAAAFQFFQKVFAGMQQQIASTTPTASAFPFPSLPTPTSMNPLLYPPQLQRIFWEAQANGTFMKLLMQLNPSILTSSGVQPSAYKKPGAAVTPIRRESTNIKASTPSSSPSKNKPSPLKNGLYKEDPPNDPSGPPHQLKV